MKSYKQIRADIAKLEREAEAARKAESASVVAKIRTLAAQYGLTAADIGLDGVRQEAGSGSPGRPSTKAASKKSARKTAAKKKKKSARSGAGTAKYRDPASGRTWSGFGRAPQWLASAKRREDFLIGSDDAQAEAGTSDKEQSGVAVVTSRPAPRAARKAGAKAPAPKAARVGKAATRPAAEALAAGEADASEEPVTQ